MAKSIGLFTVTIDPVTCSFIGPSLKPDSTEEEFADKIQQLINSYFVWGHATNKEDIPRFPKFEEKLLKSSIGCAFYAYCFLKKRWPEAEKTIAKDKEASLFYAIKVLKSRFPAGEKEISKSPEHCLVYSTLALKRGKLPDDMHRQILLTAIKDPDNKHIKRYLRFKKVRES
jgi:hypothetical protein